MAESCFILSTEVRQIFFQHKFARWHVCVWWRTLDSFKVILDEKFFQVLNSWFLVKLLHSCPHKRFKEFSIIKLLLENFSSAHLCNALVLFLYLKPGQVRRMNLKSAQGKLWNLMKVSGLLETHQTGSNLI